MLDHAATTPVEGLTPEQAEVFARLSDPWWRLTSGMLYRIKGKAPAAMDDDDAEGLEMPFIPNAMQVKFLKNLHNRNIILKSRQLGFTTLMSILELDTALFNADHNAVVIAHTEDDATEIFRDKIRYAYERLPEALRAAFPLRKQTEHQLVFAHNNSSIRVTTSARSGTAHVLHVSEMGKIAAKYPDKARELTTGSLQAVPLNGLCIIESTAEGQAGAFYELAKRAEDKWRAGKILTPQDYRFHFFGWWENPDYSLDPAHAALITVSLKDHEYFDGVEDLIGRAITQGQRAWYVAKRDEEFAHEPELMWREYPSTPDECWRSSTEGKYLARVMARARAEGRIGKYPLMPGHAVYGFWDIGASDSQALWLMQRIHGIDRFVGFRESNGEGFLPFFTWVDQLGCSVGGMYLPHDASHKVNGIEQPTSIVSQVRNARPSWSWHVVPRVSTIQHGIDLLRADFAGYCFDEEGCKEGLAHLENYKRKWNTRLACWDNEPEHDEHCHAADAIRQKAQGFSPSPRVSHNREDQRSPAALRRRSGLLA